MRTLKCHLDYCIKEYEGKGIHYLENGTENFESYAEMKKGALQFLYSLQDAGIEEGQEVVFQTNNNREFIYLLWACILGGYVAVPTGFDLKEYISNTQIISKDLINPVIIVNEQLDISSSLSSKGYMSILLSSLGKEGLDGVENEYSEEKTIMIQFSSGSTGNPKGIIFQNKTLTTNILSILNSTQWKTEERILTWLTLTHNMGLAAGHLAPLFNGMDQYLMPTREFLVKPIGWLLLIDKLKINVISCPNFATKLLLKSLKDTEIPQLDLSHVNMIINGSEPINEELCQSLIDHLSNYGLGEKTIYPVYGLAENMVAACLPEPKRVLKTISIPNGRAQVGSRLVDSQSSQGDLTAISVGMPIMGTEIRIVDEEDRVLSENYYGNIQLNGESVTLGYYNNLAETKKLFTNDGWLKTGDRGAIVQGELFIFGREKEIIIINGHNYYPHDIEQTILEKNPELLDRIAVIGLSKMDTSEEEVYVFIEKNEYQNIFDLLKIRKEIKQLVNRVKAIKIKEVYPVNEIPRTRSQKLKRVELRNRILSGHFLEYTELYKLTENINVSDDLNEQVESFVISFIEKEMDLENIELTVNFFDLGFSSIMIAKFVEIINIAFDIDISEADIFFYETPQALTEYVRNKLSEVEYIM